MTTDESLQFDTLIDYALNNRLRALVAELIDGWTVPAFEQPCRDCGELRFFRRVYHKNGPKIGYGYWSEQCAVRHIREVS